MFQSAPQLSRAVQSGPECFRGLQRAPECSRALQSAQEGSRALQRAPEHSKGLQRAPECSRATVASSWIVILENGEKWPQVVNFIWKWKKMEKCVWIFAPFFGPIGLILMQEWFFSLTFFGQLKNGRLRATFLLIFGPIELKFFVCSSYVNMCPNTKFEPNRTKKNFSCSKMKTPWKIFFARFGSNLVFGHMLT